MSRPPLRLHVTEEWLRAALDAEDEPGGIMACSPEIYKQLFRENDMHYRNGREAKNGDKIVLLEGGNVKAVGTLRDAVAGNDYCNGYVQVGHEPNVGGVTDPIACMCDCLHVDDLAAIIAEKGLDKRPAGM